MWGKNHHFPSGIIGSLVTMAAPLCISILSLGPEIFYRYGNYPPLLYLSSMRKGHLLKRKHDRYVRFSLMCPPDRFTTDDRVTFLLTDAPFRQIMDVREYRFDDITPDDFVLDIGANVGGFCIRAARLTRHVTAVEPVTAAILRENISANGVSVQVIEGALGDGSLREICWDDQCVTTPTYTLDEIIEMAGGCSFLKCDCEGAEWLIDPEDLRVVRRIEMELHLPPISGEPDPALLDYICRHYRFEIERKPCHDILGVMGVLHAERL
jgi:hypothetical protein